MLPRFLSPGAGRTAAPVAESESDNPSTKPLTPAEYQAMLAQTFGEIAQNTAQMVRQTRFAEERNQTVRLTVADYGTLKSIPHGDWKYVIVNRPGIGEQALTTLSPYSLLLDNRAYYVPPLGFAVYPYLGEELVGIGPSALAASTTPIGNWSIEVVFTNRSDIASLMTALPPLAAPTAVTPTKGTFTDRSGTIAAGGVSQMLAAANANRKYLFVQNDHATEALWINFTTAATVAQPSLWVPAGGGSFVMEAGFVSTEQVNVIAATIAHPFTAKES